MQSAFPAFGLKKRSKTGGISAFKRDPNTFFLEETSCSSEGLFHSCPSVLMCDAQHAANYHADSKPCVPHKPTVIHAGKRGPVHRSLVKTRKLDDRWIFFVTALVGGEN